MPFFLNSKSATVELKVVRAFPTSKETQTKWGIFANFSAKLMVNNHPVMSYNSLTLRVSRDGEPYVQSKFEEIVDKTGARDRVTGKVWYTTFFPGVENDSPAATKQQEKFMDELVSEIEVFIRNARSKKTDGEVETGVREIPEALRGLSSLGDDLPKAGAAEQGSDIPF